PAEDRAPADGDAVGKIYLVAGSHDGTVAQGEARVGGVDHDGVGDGVDLVHAEDLRVATDGDLVAAPDDVEVPDIRVVSDRQLPHPDDRVQMAHAHVVRNLALGRVDEAQAEAHPSPDAVAEQPP